MDARSIVANGLTVQNPRPRTALGLCPLLAVSTTVAYGLGLGLATIAVLVISNTLAALIGRWLLPRSASRCSSS
jgi:electron transport complex protein RnfE